MKLKQCIATGVFPSEWKQDNTVLIHKKKRQKTLKNDRPVSLLPICGKILERLLFKEMFFIEIKLISSNQSDFKSGESCINQLLSTSNEIYEFFDVGLEVRSLDISFLIYQKYLISFDMMVSFSN